MHFLHKTSSQETRKKLSTINFLIHWAKTTKRKKGFDQLSFSTDHDFLLEINLLILNLPRNLTTSSFHELTGLELSRDKHSRNLSALSIP